MHGRESGPDLLDAPGGWFQQRRIDKRLECDGTLRRDSAPLLHEILIVGWEVRSKRTRIVEREVRPQRAWIVEGEVRIDVLHTWIHSLKIVVVLRLCECRPDLKRPARVGINPRRRGRHDDM